MSQKPRLDPFVMENLVQAAMFHHWLTCHEQEEARSGDLSFRNAIMAAREELNRHGSSLPTLDEFVIRLKDTLTADSDEFVTRLRAQEAAEADRRARMS